MATMVGNEVLPEDVMLSILSRLPVKTLKRFSCVCKSWFATFQNPNFVRNHYITNTITASNLNIIVQTEILGCHPHPLYGYYLSSKPTMELRETIDLSSSIQNFVLQTMVGGCEGLICLYDPIDANSVVLVNPATRQVKPLPQSCTNGDGKLVFGLGLGFDCKTNDYKVLRFVIDSNNCAKHYVELYYLSTDSWKRIDSPSELEKLHQHVVDGSFNVYLKGCCHWLMDGTKGILVFDMSQEIFQTMPLPAHLLKTTSQPSCLRVFDNYLALFLRPDHVTDCFEIHVMKKYGVNESWTKQLVLGPILGVSRILGSWKSGDQWFFSTRDEATDSYQMKLYDSTTKVVKVLPIHSIDSPDLVIFTENLLPLT